MEAVSSCRGSAPGSGDDSEDVVLAHDQVLVADVLDLGAGVRTEEDPVTDLDAEGRALAVVEQLAVADRDDLAFLRLLLRALREEDASRGALLGFDALDEHAVSQGADHSGLLRGGHGLL